MSFSHVTLPSKSININIPTIKYIFEAIIQLGLSFSWNGEGNLIRKESLISFLGFFLCCFGVWILMMVSCPDLFHYACIAKGTTVLAEFNSRDEALGALAAKCLDKTPPFHSTFSHTVRSRTYTFLIDDSFVYFAIFDEKLENPDGLSFLKNVRQAFNEVLNRDSRKNRLEQWSSHCFQGEFNPVFHQLVGPGPEMEALGAPWGHRMVQSGTLQSGSGPMGRSNVDASRGLKKMNKRSLGELKEKGRNAEKKEDAVVPDEDEGTGIGLNREFSLVMNKNGLYSAELSGHHNHHKAKKVWKKQVWVVLSLDLIICIILFIVWLWVCSGFKCIDS